MEIKRFRVSEPVYGTEIIVTVGGNWGEAVKTYKEGIAPERKEDGADGRSWKVITDRGREERHIWVKQFGAGKIAHELYHACFMIAMDKGFDHLTSDNEEAFAYLLGYYMRKIIDKGYKVGADKLSNRLAKEIKQKAEKIN